MAKNHTIRTTGRGETGVCEALFSDAALQLKVTVSLEEHAL